MIEQPANPIESLIDGYLDGTLSDDEQRQLFARLETDREMLKRFAQLTELDAICREHAGNQIEVEQIRSQMLPFAEEPPPADASDLLAELAEFEASLEDSVPLVDITERLKQERLEQKRAEARRRRLDAPRATPSNAIVIPSWVAYVGLAAMVAIAALIFWPAAKPPSGPSTADNNDTQQRTPGSGVLYRVATLTGTQDAQWASEPIATGATLYADDRLILTQGFAEITTRRGAKALLQGPVTIELTADQNIRLHVGKLVGTCETKESQGFTVYTPGMRVVDLGTVFGVEVEADGSSTVKVIEGSVRAEALDPTDVSFEAVVLTRDQARRHNPSTGQLKTVALAEGPRFHTEPVHPYAAMVLDSKPLAYWRFEEASGQTIRNEAKPGHLDLLKQNNATIAGGGVHGRAARLSVGNQPLGYFEADGTFDEVAEAGVFSFACWFKADDVRQATLLSLYQPDPDENKHVINLELQPDFNTTPDQLSPWLSRSIRAVHCQPPNIDGAQGTNLLSDKPYRLDAWQHVAVVKDRDRLKLYLNGQLMGDMPAGEEIAPGAKLSLGLTQKQAKPELGLSLIDIARPLNGWMDEVAIYSRVLKPGEIQAQFKAGQPSGDLP